MTFKDFTRRYGSFRTKHINSPLAPDPRKTRLNKRIYHLDAAPDLPQEFIRMEPWEGEYLYMLASRAQLGIAEVGRYNGGSAFLMACANRQVPIYSIDNAPQNDDRLKEFMRSAGIGDNVRLLVGDSQNGVYPAIGALDLLFIDGDHSYSGCTADLRNWFGKVAEGGHIILHDCYNGRGGDDVLQAVLDFSAEERVTHAINPFIGAEHWMNSTGSLAHLIKLKT